MHERKRHIEKILIKRAKSFPVLGLLGPRQVGKSTFLMKQWQQLKNVNYDSEIAHQLINYLLNSYNFFIFV